MDIQRARACGWILDKLRHLGQSFRRAFDNFKACITPHSYKEMEAEQELDWDYLQVPDLLDICRTPQGFH